MGTPEHLAAMVSLIGPENAHLYAKIVRVGEDLFRPLLTKVISDGVAEGIFDTFDPEGVGDMIQALAARTNSKFLDVVSAADEPARDHAVDVLTTRFRLHGQAVDRILGLPDASITVLNRAQVESMVAALPRNY
jgi:TetR/AcrR family transcriptional regulator, cholesterol catabolism regulator